MRVIAILIALAVAPGATEMARDAAHWMAEGHTPHAQAVTSVDHVEHASHEHHEKEHENQEHGCSALFHVCGCHSPAPSVVSSHLTVGTSELHRALLVTVPEELRRAADGVHGEQLRPPIV